MAVLLILAHSGVILANELDLLDYSAYHVDFGAHALPC